MVIRKRVGERSIGAKVASSFRKRYRGCTKCLLRHKLHLLRHFNFNFYHKIESPFEFNYFTRWPENSVTILLSKLIDASSHWHFWKKQNTELNKQKTGLNRQQWPTVNKRLSKWHQPWFSLEQVAMRPVLVGPTIARLFNHDLPPFNNMILFHLFQFVFPIWWMLRELLAYAICLVCSADSWPLASMITNTRLLNSNKHPDKCNSAPNGPDCCETHRCNPSIDQFASGSAIVESRCS